MIFSPDGIADAIEKTLLQIKPSSTFEQISSEIQTLLSKLKEAHDHCALSEKTRLIAEMLQKQQSEDGQEAYEKRESEQIKLLTQTMNSLESDLEKALQEEHVLEESYQSLHQRVYRLNANINAKILQSQKKGIAYDPDVDRRRLAELRGRLEEASNRRDRLKATRCEKSQVQRLLQKKKGEITDARLEREERIHHHRDGALENPRIPTPPPVDYASELSKPNLKMLEEQLAESKLTLENRLNQYTPKKICEIWMDVISQAPSRFRTQQACISILQAIHQKDAQQACEKLIEKKLHAIQKVKLDIKQLQAKGIRLNSQLLENHRLQDDWESEKKITESLKHLANGLLFIVSGLLLTMIILLPLHALASGIAGLSSFMTLIASSKVKNKANQRSEKEPQLVDLNQKATQLEKEIIVLRQQTEEKKGEKTRLLKELSLLQQREPPPLINVSKAGEPSQDRANFTRLTFMQPQKSSLSQEGFMPSKTAFYTRNL